MTHLLEKAINKVNSLPEEKQDEIAEIILEELEHEQKWEVSFQNSQEALEGMAKEAIKEYHQDKTKPLDI